MCALLWLAGFNKTSGSMLIPTVKWAQRPNVVYLTIDVQDTKGVPCHSSCAGVGMGSALL